MNDEELDREDEPKCDKMKRREENEEAVSPLQRIAWKRQRR